MRVLAMMVGFLRRLLIIKSQEGPVGRSWFDSLRAKNLSEMRQQPKTSLFSLFLYQACA